MQVAPFFAWSAETVRAMTRAAQLPAPAWATIADAGVDEHPKVGWGYT